MSSPAIAAFQALLDERKVPCYYGANVIEDALQAAFPALLKEHQDDPGNPCSVCRCDVNACMDQVAGVRAEARRYRSALKRIERAMAEEEWGDDFEAAVSHAVKEALNG